MPPESPFSSTKYPIFYPHLDKWGEEKTKVCESVFDDLTPLLRLFGKLPAYAHMFPSSHPSHICHPPFLLSCSKSPYFRLNEQPSVRRALPPVGWHRTCEQPWQTTTVWACEKTVVMVKQPGHLTSMKKERGPGTRVLSLCLRASAAGVGLRRSTARTILTACLFAFVEDYV